MSDLDRLRLKDYLYHMQEAITQINEYLADCDEGNFLKKRLLQDAVVRNIEILGEAANRISKRFAQFAMEHDEIPWDAIYLMRNRIAHGYVSVDYELVWQVTQKDLPPLLSQLQNIQP